MKNMIKLTGLQDEQIYVNKKLIASLVEVERELNGVLTPMTRVNMLSGDVEHVKEWPCEIVEDHSHQAFNDT